MEQAFALRQLNSAFLNAFEEIRASDAGWAGVLPAFFIWVTARLF